MVFLERVPPAFAHVDSSSGALGAAVNAAVDALVTIFHDAPLDDKTRNALLERLWQALRDDEMPYIESLGDHWGMLCAKADIASKWADRIGVLVNDARSSKRKSWEYVNDEIAQLSALFGAERHDEVMAIVEAFGGKFWLRRRWGFRVLVARGKADEALRFAEASDPLNEQHDIARACEDLLLSLGRIDEAYRRYAMDALPYRPTYRARYLDLAKKYPSIEPGRLLGDLVKNSSGAEGKWFSASMAAKLPDEALKLAQQYPVDPKTLVRAALKYAAKDPKFAYDLCVAALRWVVEGYGYDLTTIDVIQAFDTGRAAADQIGCLDEYRHIVTVLIHAGHSYLKNVLGPRLEHMDRQS